MNSMLVNCISHMARFSHLFAGQKVVIRSFFRKDILDMLHKVLVLRAGLKLSTRDNLDRTHGTIT